MSVWVYQLDLTVGRVESESDSHVSTLSLFYGIRQEQNLEAVPLLAFEQVHAGCRIAGARPHVRPGCCEQELGNLAAKAELICWHS